MDKLPMCRICLVENVSMYEVVNKNLHKVYEKLTDIPFVTKDRPMLACFFCCAKLKQCFRLLRKCLEAEELFAQMMNEDYKPNPSKSQNLHCCTGFIQSPIVHVSIVDDWETDSIAIKEEVPAISERQDDVIEPKEEYLSDDLDLEYQNNTCLDIEDIPPHLSESDSGGDVKIEEEQELSKKKRRVVENNRAPVTKKPKLDTRTIKQEETITAQLKKNEQSNLQVSAKKLCTSLKESYKCDQRSLNQVKKLKQHTRTGVCEKPYECDYCQHRFREKRHLTAHIRVHTGEKPYKCDVCQRSFSHNGNLTNHIRMHTGKKPYECDICQRSFREKGALVIHIRVHTGEKPYKCGVCQRGFSRKGQLTRHIRVHTGEKPYKCSECKRTFNQKGILTEHIRTHTGEKPYKCCECQRSFSRKGNLTKHFRIHTGEKPYKCDVCQQSFSKKATMLNHTRTHTGEKPF